MERGGTSAANGAERSGWRWPAAALSLIVAAAQVPVTSDYLRQAPYMGWALVVLEAVSLVLAGMLLVRDTWRVWRLTVVVPALAISAYLVARLMALPQIEDNKTNWAESSSYVALTAEILLLVVGSIHRVRTGSRLILGPVALAAVVLVVGLFATGWAWTHSGQ